MSVWFGLPFEAIHLKVTQDVLEQVLQYLDSLPASDKAIKNGDAQDAYYALWAMAFKDVLTALPHAGLCLIHLSVERRFAAI